MKLIARSLVVIFVALIAVPALAVTQTITTAVQLLAATTGLFMGGTQHPLSNPPDSDAFIDEYMDLAETNYIIPVTGAVPNSRVAVIYPAEFFPVFGSRTFDDSVLVGRQNLNSCIRGEPATVPFLYRGPPGTHSLSSATRRVPWWLRSSSRTSLTTPRVRRPYTDAPSEGTKPRPLRDLLRSPIKFDPPQRPSAVRQNGDGPLKRVINALTGQRPDPAGETGPGGEEPKPASETPAA
jgi:hypothetical protein